MKKITSNGEKNEVKLKYRLKELKKAGKVRHDMHLNEFRKSEFNAFVTKEVVIVVGKKKKNVTRKVKKYVSLETLREASEITFPSAVKKEKVVVSKSERREARRHLKHVILKMIQEAAALRKEQKKLNRELRIAHAQERKDLKVRQELERIVLRVAA